MVLFPLVIYPLVSLVTAQVLAARTARIEAHVARVAVSGPACPGRRVCAAASPAPAWSWSRAPTAQRVPSWLPAASMPSPK